jgi:hypothetical protein
LDSQTLAIENLVNPYYQRWSLGIQRELPANFVFDISYVGSKGTKLFINEDLNPLVPPALRVTPPGFTGTPSGRLDNIQGSRLIRTNGGNSIYHAGQLFVQRRFSNGLAVSGAYTYSKLIDNSSEVFQVAETGEPQQSPIPSIFGGLRLNRAVSFFDRTHRASFTYVYDLPWMREQQGVIGHILGGWQISGVTTFESGPPLSIFNGADADSIGGNWDRPDHNPNGQRGVRAVPVVQGGVIVRYINPEAGNATIDPSQAEFIGIPANSGRTGTLGRNTERAPGINNWNFNLQKRIAITERVGLEFRTEFFNIFNHPQPGVPSVSPFSPGEAGNGIGVTVVGTADGRFLNTTFPDAGGRVIRWQLRLEF